MFCRNCGSEMNENAAVCVKCGISKGDPYLWRERDSSELSAVSDRRYADTYE